MTQGMRPTYDSYLLEIGLARRYHLDPSSLFRAFSAHLYGSPKYHRYVRQACFLYMSQHSVTYGPLVGTDYPAYLKALKSSKTPGTMVDLKALSALYRANVLVYEPFTVGDHMVYNQAYRRTFRVFYDPMTHRYDPVFLVSDANPRVARFPGIVPGPSQQRIVPRTTR